MSNENFQCSLTIEKYTGAAEVVEIPAEINGVPVTEIGDDIFEGCENLKCVYIDTDNWSYASVKETFGENPQFEILPLE